MASTTGQVRLARSSLRRQQGKAGGKGRAGRSRAKGVAGRGAWLGRAAPRDVRNLSV